MLKVARRKSQRIARALALVAVILTPALAYAPIFPLEDGRQTLPRGEARGVYEGFEELPLESETGGDVVILKNGDFLSGKVLKVEEGAVHFAARMLEGTVKAPVASLKRIAFEKRTESEKAGRGEISLVEGGCLAASITRMDGSKLYFRTTSMPGSADVVVEMDKVSSITLGSEPLVLLRTEFADGESVRFVRNEGEWVIYQGRLLQSDPGQHAASASARVRQSGRLRYAWTLDMPDWARVGVYILASSPNVNERGSYYHVQLLGHGELMVAKSWERGEVGVFSCRVAPETGSARFKAQYDCQTGQLAIWLNERQVANLRDKSPITSGEYVILRADGRAAFDDVRVEQLGGERALSEDEKGKDVVVLKNGDRITCRVKEVSEGEVVVIGEGESREMKVAREKVWRILFGGRQSAPAKAPSVAFWNGGRLAGKIVSLNDGVLALDNEVVGRLQFEIGLLKGIVFDE